MNFGSLKEQLDRGIIKKLYIFTGEEREVMLKYIKRISNSLHNHPTFQSLKPYLATKNLFFSRSTYVIRDDMDILEQDLKDVLSLIGNNTVILLYSSIDKRKRFFKQAQKYITVFEKFTSSQLIRYTQKQLPVAEDVAIEINYLCGDDVATIENECDKLRHLNQEIDLATVRALIAPPLEDRIFDMLDAIVQKKKEKAYTLYKQLLELRESPIKIISLLYTKFKQVFLVHSYFTLSDSEIASKTGLTPYQVNRTRLTVGILTADALSHRLVAIHRAEVDIKTGRLEQYVALENLILFLLA